MMAGGSVEVVECIVVVLLDLRLLLVVLMVICFLFPWIMIISCFSYLLIFIFFILFFSSFFLLFFSCQSQSEEVYPFTTSFILYIYNCLYVFRLLISVMFLLSTFYLLNRDKKLYKSVLYYTIFSFPHNVTCKKL